MRLNPVLPKAPAVLKPTDVKLRPRGVPGIGTGDGEAIGVGVGVGNGRTGGEEVRGDGVFGECSECIELRSVWDWRRAAILGWRGVDERRYQMNTG
jgi:hypothetical protein